MGRDLTRKTSIRACTFVICANSALVARVRVLAILALSALTAGGAYAQGRDLLPSWNEGGAKQAILDFVAAVTREDSADFAPAPQRIATFDNDGTLWIEQPMYVQLAFAIDRVKALAPQHPDWEEKEPFKAVLAGDLKALAASGHEGLLKLVMETHAGMTTDEFAKNVKDWLMTARHPRFDRPYTELVYQPMIELLTFLRANGFKTFIVSGGGVEFMRAWAEHVYGAPPEQVIGSSVKTKFQMRDGAPTLIRLPEVDFIDDKAGKPVGINQGIGRRPIAAFGNSDGDLEMLQWTTLVGGGRHLGLIVHHTDAEREYAYDRKSAFGRLDVALNAAAANNWIVVDMKRDWNRVFKFQ
jgi:phosphoglycolate phosphatase-like HAD superfamily hydrolase